MTLAILGTGGHAKSIYDIVKYNKKIYFFDKEINLFNVGNKKFRVKRESELLNSHIRGISKVIIAIGNNKIRKKKFDILKKLNYKIVTLIHPKSHIGYGSKIGEGSVVMQGSLINTDSLIGTNCIINSHSSIDHDCIIDNNTHVCPGVIIGGNVKIGKNCWIGLGSKIIQNCIIGDNVFVAAGAVVTKNLKSNTFVKGVPAKYAKKRMA
jgi:sugar O-acyltransferase (sialic acid O-acetyltransferase NeuD family)|tara:strand:- start:363 stop:989 length:627 start_codon:yes stop_codon:yes gene_type:complete